jgi:SPP1 gp7 family putative phage head morphogenesis protein
VQALPDNIARDYARAIISALPRIPIEILRSAFRDDARADAADDPKDVLRDIEGIKVAYFRKVTDTKIRKGAKKAAERTEAFNKSAVGRQVKTVIGINPLLAAKENYLPTVIDAFVTENVALIKTVGERYFSQIETTVKEAHASGRRASDVAKDLQERYKVADFNARRIARDQIGKLNGRLTEERQGALGITHYIWRTSKDERVRESHEEKEGEIFAWKDPPPDTGHPGEDIQCRCRAEPVITV